MKTKLTEGEAAAMTVNERLFAANLFDSFYKAAERKDAVEMKFILEQVYLTCEDVGNIIKDFLSK